MKRKVLVTGASGTVGSEVLTMLTQTTNYNISVFDVKSKRSNRVFSKFKGRLEVHFGDIRNFEDVEKACKDVDFVIHLAAMIPPMADEHPKLAYQINVEGTKNLIKGLEKHSKDAFFMYSSSVSVYGCRIDQPEITTHDELRASPRDEYGKTKIQAEELVRNSNLDWTIFRLTAIMGAGNHKATGLMFEMPLETSVEICIPQDAARAFVNGIEKKEILSREIFNLGGGENCRASYRDLLGKYFELFGLGEIDFPEYSFAEQNFHCGYYKDGDQLNEIVHFREHELVDYFNMIENSVPKAQKALTKLIKKPIKKYLLSLSHPYKAYKRRDEKDLNYYFRNLPK